ncbi:uncharacterized protein LOC119160185 isoform X1 [Rhipicephalus microplus]|uniref:uncharacterized protein LOC119160185 isoform X1 n=1 Tax=Rhipicephalus microplus TaxID=6941 RepID=UPI003F6B25DB
MKMSARNHFYRSLLKLSYSIVTSMIPTRCVLSRVHILVRCRLYKHVYVNRPPSRVASSDLRHRADQATTGALTSFFLSPGQAAKPLEQKRFTPRNMRTAAFWLLVAILGIGSWAVDYLDTSDESAQPIYHRNGDALEKMHDDDDLSFEGSAEKEYLPYYHGDGPHSINLHKREAHCREDVDVTYPQELIDEAERHEYIIDVYTASPSPPMSFSSL